MTDVTTFSPQNLNEAITLAERFSKTALVPKIYQGEPDAILVAWQMGSELGLQPMQALQNIAVINGQPAVYGDAALAIVRTHPDFVDIEETMLFANEEQTEVSGAQCVIRRRDQPDTVRKFTMADAQRAGLLDKQGPWKLYPKRMLQMRARGFALRDAFPDALKGLRIAEEVRDIASEKVVEDDKRADTAKQQLIEASGSEPELDLAPRRRSDELKQKMRSQTQQNASRDATDQSAADVSPDSAASGSDEGESA